MLSTTITRLRPGAETGSFSGLTLNVSDENVAISVESQRQSLAHRWFNSVSLMLIQQTGMGKEG